MNQIEERPIATRNVPLSEEFLDVAGPNDLASVGLPLPGEHVGAIECEAKTLLTLSQRSLAVFRDCARGLLTLAFFSSGPNGLMQLVRRCGKAGEALQNSHILGVERLR